MKRLSQLNSNLAPGVDFQRFHLTQPKGLSLGDDRHAEHFFIAGHQFYKLLGKWSDPNSPCPVPLRTIKHAETALASLDYIVNPKLADKFEAQRQHFLNAGKEATEVFLFHGTQAACIENILR